MIRIALRTLRFHKGGFIASFIALFFGAAIVIGCGGLFETGLRSAAPPGRLGAAPIVVTGDQSHPGTHGETVFTERVPLDASLATTIKTLPGVADAVPDLSFDATLAHDGAAAGPLKVTGHGWSSAKLGPYRLTAGTAPTGPGQVVLDARLAAKAGIGAGQRVQLLVHGGAKTLTVAGLADGTGESDTLFLSDPLAAQVAARPGKLDTIGVLTTPGADRGQVVAAIKKAAEGSPVSVLTGDRRGWAENPSIITDGTKLVTLASVFGGLSAMVTVFVVSSTTGLSIQQRQREMALLRAIGTTPGQLRRLILGETLFIAVIATGLACYPGPRVGRWLLAAFARGDVVPDALAYRAGWIPMVTGVGAALLTALGAAFISARGAARTRPTEALAEASLQRKWVSVPRLAFALLFLGGGTALALVTANMSGPMAGSTATPAAMLWTAGFGLLGPGLAKVITAVLRWPLRALTGLAGRLATLNAKARIGRMAGAVMPVMLATGLATALIYLQTTQSSGSQQAFSDNMRADLAVTSVSGGLPLSMVDTIRKQPGVAAASAQISSLGYLEPKTPPSQSEIDEGDFEPTEMPMQGVTAEGVAGTTAFHATSGSLDELHGDTVALPASEAGGFHLGDQVPMRFGDGAEASLKLVATVDARRGYETALLPASLLVQHTDAGLVPQITVTAQQGTDPARLVQNLSALAQQHPGLSVLPRAMVSAVHQSEDDTQAWMAYLVLGVVVAYATIALVNTQVLATTERRREFMLQRLIGATRRQVLRMMTVEAILVAVAGLVLGSLVAVLTLVPLSESVLGSPVPEGSPWIFATVVVAAFVLTLVTTLISAALVLRSRPGAMVGLRE
ncbi:FtsX-like permease family protein [Streptomyces sp. NBC_00083]|uniref:FtsX-like permease family protein n=1 Tax=Streptomyces sp. NBC_00083 TaxID=2975647 RepID=UPI002255145B|nr:FtsX-like permease family protein [Streptomyces sp. NBC_00083]MCX5385385.1 FtsX-like permease family protein [Streptomyces sp. NBC_00083]